MPGISARHPGQVLYQKLSMTGLPRNWLRLTCFPSSEVSVKLGATSPICRPTVAPDFTLTSLDGKQVSLSQFRGKPVMLNFWYSTCPGCLAEIPGMQRFYSAQQAAGKDFVILGVNSVDDVQTAQQFSQQYALTYSLALDNNQQVAALYNLTATPTSYFIDRQGIIRSVVVGPVDETTLQQDVTEISQA